MIYLIAGEYADCLAFVGSIEGETITANTWQEAEANHRNLNLFAVAPAIPSPYQAINKVVYQCEKLPELPTISDTPNNLIIWLLGELDKRSAMYKEYRKLEREGKVIISTYDSLDWFVSNEHKQIIKNKFPQITDACCEYIAYNSPRNKLGLLQQLQAFPSTPSLTQAKEMIPIRGDIQVLAQAYFKGDFATAIEQLEALLARDKFEDVFRLFCHDFYQYQRIQILADYPYEKIKDLVGVSEKKLNFLRKILSPMPTSKDTARKAVKLYQARVRQDYFLLFT